MIYSSCLEATSGCAQGDVGGIKIKPKLACKSRTLPTVLSLQNPNCTYISFKRIFLIKSL